MFFEYRGEIVVDSGFDSAESVDLTKVLVDLTKDPKWYLFIGEVQSGKTRKIMEIFELIYQRKNYDYIFVLSGINSSLQEQTISRFQDKFSDEYEFITRMDDYNQNSLHEDKYKVCTFLLIKSEAEMRKMSEFIEKTISYRNPTILIIDDECDYASINTNNCLEPSKIHNHIIIKAFNEIKTNGRSGLISFTATPYAYFLNEKQKDNIDKAIVMKSNPNYNGIDFFDKIKNFYLSIEDLQEKLQIQKEYEIAIFIWLLKTFMCFTSNKAEDSQLLIYEHREKSKHQSLHNEIKNFITHLQSVDNDQRFNKIINFFYLELNFADFKKWFLDVSKKINLIVLNSETQNNTIFKSGLSIIIGGDLLSRGITFKNLITELFIYDSSSCAADTLLQRCRWFGYRKNYQFMNVITTKNVIAKLKEAKKYNALFEFQKDDHYIDINLFNQKIQDLNCRNKILKGTSNDKQ